MIQIKDNKYGSDFEYFVREIATGKVVPVTGLFGGTKQEPLSIGQGCYRQIDGVAVEANIPPVTNVEDWLSAINHCKKVFSDILFQHGLELCEGSVHHFDESQFTHKRHTTFGCEPSMDAYSGRQVFPNSSEAGTMRTTGAHIHIGFRLDEDLDINTDEISHRLIHCMDKCVGIPFLQIDTNTERRKLYGKAGDYREKIFYDSEGPYMIIEYRSLGGFCMSQPKLMFELTQQAIELFNSDYEFTSEELVQQQEYLNKTKTHEYA